MDDLAHNVLGGELQACSFDPLTALIVPSLLCAVLVFIGSSIIHMVLKYHASDYSQIPNEDAVRAAMRAGNPAPKKYIVPWCPDMKAMQSEEMKQILRIHLAAQALGRPFAAPPGIPADRKAAQRAAFDATMKDKEFVEETKKVRLEVSPISGAGIDGLLDAIYKSPPELVAKAKQIMKQ